jgi:diguanylate cyclase (GGDEF)-like protein
MQLWSTATLNSAFVPGGIILAVASLFIQHSWITLSPSALAFSYYAVFVAALVLSLRFRSLRIVFGAAALLLAHYALTAKGPVLHSGAGRTAFEAVALLVPLDFILLTWIPERTLRREHLIGIAAVLFFQSTFVAVFARPDQPEWSLLHFSLIRAYHLRLPQPALLMFVAALGILLWRVLRFHKAIDHGLFWSLLTACIGLEAGGASKSGTAYFATSGLILASCIVENSYSLAYRDELTGLRSRRAFNDALAVLKPPYAIAAVDIDHFKSINDTYGHDSGDQVLRLVASRLAGVSGGGESYRVGGEEFTILFPARNAQEIFAHLELLRMNIESCSFRLRKNEDRRKTPRESDRRTAAASKPKTKAPARPASGALSVTVSIGIAESRSNASVEQIIEQADKALYSAKQGGRNRIEVAGAEKKPRRSGKASKPAQS